MDKLYEQTRAWMQSHLDVLVSSIAPPRRVRLRDGIAYRYFEKTPQQAVVQQLARTISGLRASSLLLAHDLLQEQIAVCRMVNEFEDDITFLTLASMQDPQPDILTRYLEAFYAEETSLQQLESGERVKGRNLVSRKDIAKFLAKVSQDAKGSFEQSNTQLGLSFALSGYVHGASGHIMEMYEPTSGRFVTDRWVDHPLREDHEHDIWNYYYRGILAVVFAAACIGQADVNTSAKRYIEYFKATSGSRVDF